MTYSITQGFEFIPFYEMAEQVAAYIRKNHKATEADEVLENYFNSDTPPSLGELNDFVGENYAEILSALDLPNPFDEMEEEPTPRRNEMDGWMEAYEGEIKGGKTIMEKFEDEFGVDYEESDGEDEDPFMDGTASYIDGKYKTRNGFFVVIDTRLGTVSVDQGDDESYFFQDEEGDQAIREICRIWKENDDITQDEAVARWVEGLA